MIARTQSNLCYGTQFPRVAACWIVRARRVLLLCVLGNLFGLFPLSVFAQREAPSESEVKAAFLINFAKYVEWPAKSLRAEAEPIVIGIAGKTDLDEQLSKLLKGRSINGRPIVFRKVSSPNETLDGCHILFIPESEKAHAEKIITGLDNAAVLTVGESKDFLEQNGMINLVLRDHKVRLEVNLAAVQRASLKVSSKLLSAADVVKGRSKE